MIITASEGPAAFKTVYSDVHNATDIPYADESEAQKLDIYFPDKIAGPYPVIVSIHGGGYCSGDKMGSDTVAAWEGLKRGYAVVALNYRLSGEDLFPAQIHDVKAAIRFLRANAEKYDLDPDRIAVWGSSAGGTLAAMLGTSADVQELQDLDEENADQSEKVQAVVDWCGPMNLLTMDQQFKESGIAGHFQNNPGSFGSKYLGQIVSEVPELAVQANPETYITPDDPPFFIQHGTADDWVPVQQSIEFAAQLEQVLGKDKVKLEIIEGAGHGGARFMDINNINKVLDFLDETLQNKN